MTTTWFRQPVRVFQHLLRERDAIGLDPAALIDEAREMQAEAYVSMGAGFSAWYPTALSSQQVNPHLEGDFLGDVVAAAHRHGIKAIARVDISKGRAAWLARDPDWFVQQADGAPKLIWEMPQTCATGPFWQREAFAMLEEMLARYPVDGFFFNYFNVAQCHCPRCQTTVRAATGAGVPKPGARSPVYERWRQRFLADYLRRVRDFVHARAPHVALIPYHHVRDGWSYRAMAAQTDIVSAQCSNPVVVNPIDPQPQWTHWAAEEALLARAVKPDAAPMLVHSGSAFFASRQTAIPAGRMIRSLAQATAHGASPMPAINGRLAQDDPRSIARLREFSRLHARNADWYRGLRSLARIAILRSQDSIDWGPDRGRPAGDPLVPGHVAEFRGSYEMVAALRYPCDVLPDGGLSVEALMRYQAVIAPAVSCLNPADAAALDAYVAAGGTLIATADFAACDGDGGRRAAPALACLPALPGEGRPIFGAYFKLADAALRTRLEDIPHVGADGAFWTPHLADARQDLRLIGPFRNNAPEFTLVEGDGAEPGLLRRAHGKGEAIWLPWRIGALHHAFAIADYAAILGHVLEPAIGAPPIRTDAPAAVECILYGHARGEVLHLVNGAAAQTKPMIATVPLAGFEVAVTTAATNAIRLDTGAALPAAREGDSLRFAIERLDSFLAIALTSPRAR